MLSVIILTHNESMHIRRAIESVRDIADHIYIVDSGSTDNSIEIAESLGAKTSFHPWLNHATQLNWAIDQLPKDTQWVMRLDADEYIDDELREQIAQRLDGLADDIKGIRIGRRMTFLRRPIYYGGLFPTPVVRFFRYGFGRCENRWMDEHLIIEGNITDFSGELIDDNKNNLGWWTQKHNNYASREAVEMLNQKYNFLPIEGQLDNKHNDQAGRKRWIKNNVYNKISPSLRGALYFIYRYFIRLGFLDGKEGLAFHFLQGFWYRFLVDSKMLEVEMQLRPDYPIKTAIKDILGIDLDQK